MIIPSHLRAIIPMVVAMGVFIGSDSCMKIALADAPMFQLMFMRGFAAVTICLVLLVAMGQTSGFSRMFNPWLVARGLLEVGANFSFTIAIIYMSIADMTAIAQTCPLFVLVGARLIYGERLGSVRVFLVIVGIIGSLMVAQPGATAASPYALLGFATAIFAAIRDLITRKVPQDIPALVVALTVLVLLMAAGGIGMLAFETPMVPGTHHVVLMMLAGALLITGHVLIYVAYRIGPARTVAPFMYTLTIWAVLSGVILFGDIPNALAIAGMTIVVLAGLSIIMLDGRQRRTAAAAEVSV
ncbi:DMT family transporter [Aestuariivirga sp.]|uniref:DMT family transporter n=1 Tax=Aestuariivirga sp. TaxID=2650926 RepID=UPI003594263E